MTEGAVLASSAGRACPSARVTGAAQLRRRKKRARWRGSRRGCEQPRLRAELTGRPQGRVETASGRAWEP